jgi:peptidoglycan/xylan/chitin deacetylase (PgdA/CDA1 family)
MIMRVIALAVAILALGAAPATAGELLANPGAETPDATGNAPASWTASSWGTATPTFTWSTDAHSGQRSLRVDVTSYASPGDSKWVPDLVAVEGGAYYVYSDWYTASANSAVSVYYETASGDGHWANLFAGIAPRSQWTRYSTGFTMPADAVRAQFVHFLAADGSLQTDDHSLLATAAPPGFARPMVSLTFDDGSQAFHDDALPVLAAHGFTTTQYVPTRGLGSDPFLMTPAELRELVAAGHEIGSHTVSHADLTTLDDDALDTELRDSKSQLETVTGASVTGIAYPFGSYDARVIATAQALGYTAGRSVEDGYNGPLDLERFDLRGQNITSTTTLEQFKSWVDYAVAHNYWLVVIYHEVVAAGPPGPYDTTLSDFRAQLGYLARTGVDVLPAGAALERAEHELHAPITGDVSLSPARPRTNTTLTAAPSAFTDPDGDALSYEYRWFVNGAELGGEHGARLDLAHAGHGDRGDTISVAVTARDVAGHTSAAARASATVVNSPPTAGIIMLAREAAGCIATPTGFGDADGDTLDYHFDWFVNGAPAPAGAPGARPGDVVSVHVRAGDGEDSVTATATLTLPADPTPAATPALPADPTPTARPALPADPTPTVTTVTPPRADTTAPRISVVRPRARTYRPGSRITLRFSARDLSGVAKLRATVRRRGGRARTVRSGARLRLTRPGTYILRVTATDRAGNTRTTTVTFHVRRPSIDGSASSGR